MLNATPAQEPHDGLCGAALERHLAQLLRLDERAMQIEWPHRMGATRALTPTVIHIYNNTFNFVVHLYLSLPESR